MNLNPLHKSTPQTLKDRAKGVAKDGVEMVRTTRDETVSLARRGERFLSSSRSRALAVAGAATGAAAGFAFWRSRKDEGPSVHHDPAQPGAPATPQSPPEASGAPEMPSATASEATPSAGSPNVKSKSKSRSKQPVTDTKAAASNAAGSRSK
jgi:hypothetical protein